MTDIMSIQYVRGFFKVTLRLHTRLLHQLTRRVHSLVLHHRQQDSSGGFGIGLSVVVVEVMADVGGNGIELVVG
jgi:hypothetical protein